MRRGENRHILVHCQLGVSRSAAVVAGFLVQEMNLTLEQAIAHLEIVRPRVRINSGFKDQLGVFESRKRDGTSDGFDEETLVRAAAFSFRPKLDFPSTDPSFEPQAQYTGVFFDSNEVDLAAKNILRMFLAWGALDVERGRLRVAAYKCLRNGVFFEDQLERFTRRPVDINAACDVLEKALDGIALDEADLQIDFPLIGKLIREARGLFTSWRVVVDAGRDDDAPDHNQAD